MGLLLSNRERTGEEVNEPYISGTPPITVVFAVTRGLMHDESHIEDSVMVWYLFQTMDKFMVKTACFQDGLLEWS